MSLISWMYRSVRNKENDPSKQRKVDLFYERLRAIALLSLVYAVIVAVCVLQAKSSTSYYYDGIEKSYTNTYPSQLIDFILKQIRK